jgi:DNA-binding MarR family transcriptional regulator
VGRRALLGMLGAGAAALATAPYLQRGWENALGAASQLDATGLTGLLPDPGGFRYYSVVGSVPRKDETDYALTVGGLVDRKKTYTLADLRAMSQTRVVADVLCTDGWRVDDTPFEGVKLADILDDAGVRSPGAAVRFTCFDGAYTPMAHLSETKDRQLRMSDLAAAIDMSHSGIARLASRLEAQGLIRRVRSTEDARDYHAILTDEGFARLEKAWPTNLASMRRHFLDHLAGLDLKKLAVALRNIAT